MLIAMKQRNDSGGSAPELQLHISSFLGKWLKERDLQIEWAKETRKHGGFAASHDAKACVISELLDDMTSFLESPEKWAINQAEKEKEAAR